MSNLEKKLLQSAAGERRANPDEMRQFLGTYRERVLLTIDKGQANRPDIKEAFPKILADLKKEYDVVKVKSCPNLSQTNQILYMKMTQDAGLSFTNVNENKGDHPFDLLVHTDKAVNLADTAITSQYCQYLNQANSDEASAKKVSFWKRLFK